MPLPKASVQKVIEHWQHLASIVHKPNTTDEYQKLSYLLDQLLDIVGEDESHPLIGLIDAVSYMIESYDKKYQTKLGGKTGIDALKYLMQQHGIKQADLSEIGSQGIVSEILHGKRQLNLNQLRRLSTRFNVSLDTFVD